jgi:hypothetical protein
MKNIKPSVKALLKLIDQVGSQEALANELTKRGYKIGQSAIALWIYRNRVSKTFAVHIEDVFGKPDRYTLCPEYWGKKPNNLRKSSKQSGRSVGKHRQAS